MTGKELNILVAAADNAATATLVREITGRIPADIVHVQSRAEAAAACETRAFDVILAAETLVDGRGADLLEEPLVVVPVVLVCETSSAEALLSAFRGGVADVLTGPIDLAYLVDTLRAVVKRHRDMEQANRRASRLRSLSSRLIRDRRELRRRVDLICTDIVSAYQLLARKVVAATGAREAERIDLTGFSADADD